MAESTVSPVLVSSSPVGGLPALPEAFDPCWNRLSGITADGKKITLAPEKGFFRFEVNPWLIIAWQTVKNGLLEA
ncbi:hypothetical protein [Streptomyces sp. FH025]|uniref:hypothetical protein n=1 Tax=Streptomyces sp. FH025 TaxID=2815937 RepID=UPI001A9D4525|nr:hypothetical protein [Streptomyces sp. FH025]MBO1415427.1 hypothetical protein [Streptomyces sp. FH025]